MPFEAEFGEIEISLSRHLVTLQTECSAVVIEPSLKIRDNLREQLREDLLN